MAAVGVITPEVTVFLDVDVVILVVVAEVKVLGGVPTSTRRIVLLIIVGISMVPCCPLAYVSGDSMVPLVPLIT